MYDNQNNPYAAPAAPSYPSQPVQGAPQTSLPPEMIYVSTGARLNLISLIMAILFYLLVAGFGIWIGIQAAQQTRGNIKLLEQEIEKHSTSLYLLGLLVLIPILISLYGYLQYCKIPEESQARPAAKMLVIFGIVTLTLKLASSLLPMLGIFSAHAIGSFALALFTMLCALPYYYFYFKFLNQTGHYIQDAVLITKVKTLSTFAYIFMGCGVLSAILNLISNPMNQKADIVAALRIPLGLVIIVTGIVTLVFYIQSLLRLQKVINYRTQIPYAIKR
jgi:uncharacterized membrane protein YidH (DUF202 family)